MHFAKICLCLMLCLSMYAATVEAETKIDGGISRDHNGGVRGHGGFSHTPKSDGPEVYGHGSVGRGGSSGMISVRGRF